MLNELEADRIRRELLKGGFGKDFNRVKKEQNKQRRIAEQERETKEDKKGSKPTFLRPSDISGDYDVKRALKTTLGMPEGVLRALTADDLEAFRHNITQMQTAYKGGISVEQVISLSTQADINRANKQIYLAMPVRRKGDEVHFITNSSRDEKDPKKPPYYHVNVQFASFNELVFNPDLVKKTTVQNRLSKGNVKYECNCGRFNFWFRYLNTVAGTVLGRKEGGYPKEKNPMLTGIACKHILRVMHWIKSGQGQSFLANALIEERTKQVGAKYKTGKSLVSRMLSEQIVKAGTKRNEIKGNLNKEIARIEAKARRQAQALARKEQVNQTKHQALQKIKGLFEQGILSKAEYELLSKRL